MKIILKPLLAILFTFQLISPAAQARAISHEKAFVFVKKQITEIRTFFEKGSLDEDEARFLVLMTRDAFKITMLTEYGLKYIRNQKKGIQKYNEDEVVKSVDAIFTQYDKGEISFYDLDSGLKKISEGTERPGN
jgi:hypothetical protein